MFSRIAGLAFVGAASVASAPASAGAYGSVYSFNGGTDGSAPLSGLLKVGGKLYGTTVFGGTGNCHLIGFSGCGTVFKFDPNTGAETIVHSFTGSDGFQPSATLIDVRGILYGTTGFGGTCGCGTVFGLSPKTGALTVIHSFQPGGDDGTYPFASLTNVGGMLYGTTQYGGATNNGTVFSIDLSTGAEKVVYSFQGGSDGAYSIAGLTKYKNVLYGTTLRGGTMDNGTVFALDPASGAESVVYSLQGGNDGAHPYAGVINVGGKLFGATRHGGGQGCDGSGCGVVFSVNPATGNETIVHTFAGPDGATPLGSLVHVRGTLYGTTISGGLSLTSSTNGTIYSIDPATGAETVLHSFGNPGDGRQPRTTLVDVNGTLYGTTSCGGTAGTATSCAGSPGYGTVFSFTP
ncbi:MAG: PQQ-binding-like beta-propeller repeat protein [Alphaproteobacteria bacterium]|nr:PQQ-binding-like beta-propeller repeat protein [Alphaproteobacteria bacterium]